MYIVLQSIKTDGKQRCFPPVFYQKMTISSNRLNRQAEIGRGGRRFSFESKEKQKTCFERRKSSNPKLKQECCPPLPGRPAKLALLCASAQRKTAGQTEK